jgi:branched-chain amino acid transport system ATP-binding protein
MSLLNLNKINGFYGDIQVLYDVSIKVEEGEIVTIVGANGAGKTTLLKIISGLFQPKSGTITFINQRIDNLPSHEIVRKGIVQVPEGRKLFPFLTVLENLEVGAYVPHASKHLKESLKMIFELFPILSERKKQLARTLSGGEQQMLAIARGLMTKPKLLMLDEPSLGLAPILVKEVFEIVKTVKKQNIPILLVEQNVKHSLEVSNRAYVLENGKIVLEGKGKELLGNEKVKKAYLGM